MLSKLNDENRELLSQASRTDDLEAKLVEEQATVQQLINDHTEVRKALSQELEEKAGEIDNLERGKAAVHEQLIAQGEKLQAFVLSQPMYKFVNYE